MIKNLPLHTTKQVNGLSISISHNLQNKNYGGDLWPTNNQDRFDQLFENDYDIAVYAHTHHQLLRYSSKDQMVINPGTIGQPFYKWDTFRSDRRAQYAILEVDATGIAEVRFKRITYDIEKEWKNAMAKNIPYVDLYREMLETGKIHTHNLELLQQYNARYNYRQEVMRFFKKDIWNGK